MERYRATLVVAQVVRLRLPFPMLNHLSCNATGQFVSMDRRLQSNYIVGNFSSNL